jgi:DNA-directed RNA polymerase specialized sigma subunit
MTDLNEENEDFSPEDGDEEGDEIPEASSSAASIYADRRAKDLELFHALKQSGAKKDLSALMHQIDPIVQKEVQKRVGSLPRATLSSSGKRWALKALETYDPSKGAALGTHVTSYMRKISRQNYRLQNAVMLPEDVHLKYQSYTHAKEALTDELGQEPTEDELAKRLGWSKAMVVRLKGGLYDDLVESSSERPAEFATHNENALLMEYLRSTLSPDELYIMDNAKAVSSQEMAEHLGVNISRLNYLKLKLVQKIQEIRKDLGE